MKIAFILALTLPLSGQQINTLIQNKGETAANQAYISTASNAVTWANIPNTDLTHALGFDTTAHQFILRTLGTGGTQLKVQVIPPVAGQYVVVYPTTGTIIADNPRTLPASTIDNLSGVLNYQCPSSLCTPGFTEGQWAGFTLPSFVLPGNVTAVYAFGVSQATASGPMPNPTITCTVGPHTASAAPTTFGWSLLQATTLMTGVVGADIPSITCQSGQTGSLFGDKQSQMTVDAVGLIVYYTGTPPPADTSILIAPPLSYTPLTRTLGFDSTILNLNSTTGVYTFNGALNYTALTPAPLTNANLVLAGDSRFAGTVVPAGQGFADYIVAQPQFANRVTLYNGAVSGATCATMTSAYATNVQPHKPTAGITTAYLFIQEGINDVGAGTVLGTLETCYSAYVAQAVADGFTPVLFTPYYWTVATDAQETVREQFNLWIKTTLAPNYLVIDSDWLFPPTNPGGPYYVDSLHFNGTGNLAWAQATNFLWGLGKSGTNLFANTERNNYTLLNGSVRYYGNLVVGIPSGTSMNAGDIMANFSSTIGQVYLGADGNVKILRSAGDFTTFLTNGGLAIKLGDTAGAYKAQWQNSSAATIASVDSLGRFVGTSYNAPITTPASSSAACTTGTAVWDTGFVYICTATNTWKRTALSTF